MAIESAIRWGDNYDNELSFEHPQLADDKVAWREPAPGSRRIRNGAGVTDAWVRKYDYKLSLRGRYFSRQSWSGLGLQDFLDWAGEGNTFRYIPDVTYPNFYVDDCYLDSPFEGRRPDLEQSDGTKSLDLVIRQQAFDFDWAERGVMFEYIAGKPIAQIGGTHARADATTCATYTDRNGVVQTVAAHVLRDAHFIGGVRHTLLEPTRANAWTFSEQFDDAAWTKNNATVSANAVTAPDGTATMDAIMETTAISPTHGLTRNLTGAADNTKQSFGFVVKGGLGRTWLRLRCLRKDNTAVDAWFNVDAGAWGTVESGITAFTPVALSGSTYRISIAVDVLTGGTTPRCDLATSTADANESAFAGDTAKGFYCWGGQFELDAAYPTSYIKTEGSAVTRAADVLTFPFSYAPQEMTVDCKFTEQGTVSGADSARIWYLGNSTNADPRFLLFKTVGANRYSLVHDPASLSTSNLSGVAPTISDTVELRATLSGAGIAQLHGSLNGAAEVSATAGAAQALGGAWAVPTLLYLNQAPGAATDGCVALQSIRFMAGTQALSAIQAA